MKGITGKPGRPRPLASFTAANLIVDVEPTLNIVIRSPRLGEPDVVLDVANLSALRRALDLAEHRRDHENEVIRWT